MLYLDAAPRLVNCVQASGEIRAELDMQKGNNCAFLSRVYLIVEVMEVKAAEKLRCTVGRCCDKGS